MGEKKEVVLGLDIGVVTTSSVILDLEGNSLLTNYQRHNGNPRDTVKTLCAKLQENFNIINITAVGEMSGILQAPVIIMPEQAAIEEAAKFLFKGKYDSFAVLRIGGSGFSILIFKDGKFSYAENDKCSAGTGVAIEKICNGKFGLSVENACVLSEEATKTVKSAKRCSVFANSDMTHHSNDGHLDSEILKGFFDGVASNIFAFFEQNAIQGEVKLIGGVSTNRPITDKLIALISKTGKTAAVAKTNEIFEAFGAARIAFKKQSSPKKIFNFSNILAPIKQEIDILPPISSFKNLVAEYPANIETAFDENQNAVLGLDLGSTGSKIAIVQNGKIVYTDYTPTNAKPLQAAQKLIKKVPSEMLSKIVLVGLTGSGRNTVAVALKTACPELSGKIFVKTEIVAHAKGACHFDPANGDSITVCEIGGEDAKIIQLEKGDVIDYDMNKACSAGTGSFFDGQRKIFKILNIVEFNKMALNAKRTPNLGQQCTVFIEDNANKALSEGCSLEEICSGMYLSVAKNYVNRVMGQRKWGKYIFLQGMPAKDGALACAFAALTGKQILVPPNTGAMGAIGISLLAAEEREADEKKIFNFSNFQSTKIVERTTFQCKHCDALCTINKMVLSINEEERTVCYGGNCPRYEKSEDVKIPADMPNPFSLRRKLLENALAKYVSTPFSDKKTVGIPVALGNIKFIPLFAAFFNNLNFNVTILETDKFTLEVGNKKCSYMCAPVKVIHGLIEQAKEKLDYVFLPKVENLPIQKDEDNSCTCPLSQGTPNLVEWSQKESSISLLMPILDFKKGLDSKKVRDRFLEIGQELEVSRDKAISAYASALKVQSEFQEGLLDIGRKALKYAKGKKIPIVLAMGRMYVLGDNILNSMIPQIIQQKGAIALPIDCFPTNSDIPSLDLMYWGEGQRNFRALLDIFQRKNIFPLWLTSFSCGPDSFIEHFFNTECRGYPHVILETDGHSGTGGYNTRIEAFLHTCNVYSRKNPMGACRTNGMSVFSKAYSSINAKVNIIRDRKLFIPSMGGGDGNKFLEAAYRSFGINAIALQPVDAEAFSMGQKFCSGKECLPFICLWGNIYQKILSQNGNSEKSTFLVPATGGPCRFCAYNVLIRQFLKDIGKDKDIFLYSPTTEDSYNAGISGLGRLKMWAALVSYDLLTAMKLHIRPIAKDPLQAEFIYSLYKKEFIKELENSNTFSVPNILKSLMKDASLAFSRIEIDPLKKSKIVDVLLAGEIYVRQEQFANKDIIKRLEALGMRVKLSPNREWINYVSYCEWIDKRNFKVWKERFAQKHIEQKLYNICAKALDWPHDHSIEDIVEMGYPYMGRIPEGEANLIIGSVRLMHSLQEISAAIVIGPVGCMPTNLGIAQLLRILGIPILPIYVDENPINKKLLKTFAWQQIGAEG